MAPRLQVLDGGAVPGSPVTSDPLQFQTACVEAFVASWHARGFSAVTIENDTALLERMLTALGCPAWEVTAEDIDRVVGQLAPAARDYALFRTLYHAGLRSEEASLLERADVHFGRGPFGKLHVRFGKGAHTSGPRPRWVPMLDGLDLVLEWFLADVRGKFPDSLVLFADESGGPLHRGTIRNRLRYLMQLEGQAAGEWFSPHALRRACATHNYERGMDLVAIQQMLGHWTVGSTMKYVRPSATFIEDAYRRAVTGTLASLTEEGDPA